MVMVIGMLMVLTTITSIDTITINSTLGVTGAYSAATHQWIWVHYYTFTVVSNLSALDGTLELDLVDSLASAQLVLLHILVVLMLILF